MLKDYPLASIDYMHVIPVDDFKNNELFIHATSINCECYPVVDEENPNIISHNAYDNREAKERFGATIKPWINVREIRPITLCELI